MATIFHRPEDHSVAIAEQAATRELVSPNRSIRGMSLPRKDIAEGIAAAIMVGVGGERGARQGDRWQFGEIYMRATGHASPIVKPTRMIIGDRALDASAVDRLLAALRKKSEVA